MRQYHVVMELPDVVGDPGPALYSTLGSFTTRAKAERLLREYREKGYVQVYIVDIVTEVLSRWAMAHRAMRQAAVHQGPPPKTKATRPDRYRGAVQGQGESPKAPPKYKGKRWEQNFATTATSFEGPLRPRRTA